MTEGFIACRLSDEQSGGLGRLPLSNQLMQADLGRTAFDAFTQSSVAEQFSDLGQDFQMLLSGRFRHQQKDQQIDGLLVWRIKADGLGQLEDGSHGGFETLDASVWDGNTMAQARRAQSLAGKQAVGDKGTRQAMQILKEKSGFFECTFLAGGFHPHKNLGNRQYG